MQQVDALATRAEFRICCVLGQGYIVPGSNTEILVQDGYLILRGVLVGLAVFGKNKRRENQESRNHGPARCDFHLTFLVRNYCAKFSQITKNNSVMRITQAIRCSSPTA
jgi:hypothetical protein